MAWVTFPVDDKEKKKNTKNRADMDRQTHEIISIRLPACVVEPCLQTREEGRKTNKTSHHRSSFPLCVCMFVCVLSLFLSLTLYVLRSPFPSPFSFPSLPFHPRYFIIIIIHAMEKGCVSVRPQRVCVCATNIKKMRAYELIQKEGQKRSVIEPYVIIPFVRDTPSASSSSHPRTVRLAFL